MTPAHLHLILNHVPVVGFPLATLLLLVAWMRKSRELQSVALAGALLVSLTTVSAFMTGEPAEHQIEHAPGVTKEHIEAHEDMARISLGLGLLCGIAAGTVLVLGRVRGPSRGGVALTLVIALATCGALAVTSERGGHIRHPEITPGAISGSEAPDRD